MIKVNQSMSQSSVSLAERRHQFIIYLAILCLPGWKKTPVHLQHNMLTPAAATITTILLLVILSFDKLDSYLPPQHLHLSPTISTTTTPTTFTCFACDSTTTSASSSTRDYDFHQYQRLLLPPVLPATIIPFIPYSDPSSVIKENRKRRERKRFSDQTIISTTTTIIREYSQWICFDISYPFSMTISSFEHENLPMHVDH